MRLRIRPRASGMRSINFSFASCASPCFLSYRERSFLYDKKFAPVERLALFFSFSNILCSSNIFLSFMNKKITFFHFIKIIADQTLRKMPYYIETNLLL